MVHRPSGLSAFEFVVLASLRAVQLSRGSVPRVEGVHKRTVTAQLEVASGLVARSLASDEAAREPI
jgi:DNA-directed RNA polymerase subunit K/omega